jgi:SAM-dependent methyltransferase
MSEQSILDPAQVEQLMGRLLTDMAASAGVQMIQIGIKAGLWKAMARAGQLSPAELAARAGIATPYAREWLRHQAASGYVAYDPSTELFELPAASAAVLADDTQSGFVEGFAGMLAAMATDLGLVEKAFHTGQGVGWHQRSAAHWHGMDLASSADVVPALAALWIPALDGVQQRLRAGASVADVGCGYGSALIALAQAFPQSRFTGFDYHDASIAHARKAAVNAGVADRVVFEVADASAITGGGYDLVTFIDALHDLGDPTGALRHARSVLAENGTVLLAEFAVADRLEDNFNAMGRLLYASSALVCTPNAVSQGATDPLGSAPGEARLTEVARDAGFTRVRRVPVEAPFNLLLELRP